MPPQNIVASAIENGLTLKQERFSRAIANGATVCAAEHEVGYNSPDSGYKSSLGSRVMKNEKVQTRIAELISSRDYEALAASTWTELLTINLGEFEPGKMQWSNIVDKKLKAIEQIAKLAGWEPNKTTETKSLVLKGDLTDLLPK